MPESDQTETDGGATEETADDAETADAGDDPDGEDENGR